MIGGKNVLGLIPARGGSKGIPGKNIKKLGGRPLLSWTIDAALEAVVIDSVVVSTDDEKIADTARRHGAQVPFMRPKKLAADTTPGVEVALHALEQQTDADVLVLLQPTSPFRSTQDIDDAVTMWSRGDGPVVSVCETPKSPFWMFTLDEHEKLEPVISNRPSVTNRQGLPTTYVLNGAIYVVSRSYLETQRKLVGRSTRAYIMPSERSVDLDTEIDWAFAECLLSTKSK